MSAAENFPPAGATQARALTDAAQQRALRIIAAGEPLSAVLSQLTSAAEAVAGGRSVASILVLDREGLLRNGASPNLPADYLDAIDRLKPDAKVGTCAAAAATGEIVVTPNFFEDSRWPELRHLPLALGFVGGWSMPIKSASGLVLGTFGSYFRERREPTSLERESVALLAGVAAQAIGEPKAVPG